MSATNAVVSPRTPEKPGAGNLLGLHDVVGNLRHVILNAMLSSGLVASSPRPSARLLNDTATQIALVVAGIRSGFLLDSFAVHPARDRLERFMEHERLLPSALGACCEVTAGHIFFVNIELLNSRIAARAFPLWIHQSKIVSEPPFFEPLIRQILFETSRACFLSVESQLELIPLAAFLLEYPTAYIVSQERPYLVDVTLNVYDWSIVASHERLPLIKYSIPNCCDRGDTIATVRQIFEERTGESVEVAHTSAYFDRVAL